MNDRGVRSGRNKAGTTSVSCEMPSQQAIPFEAVPMRPFTPHTADARFVGSWSSSLCIANLRPRPNVLPSLWTLLHLSQMGRLLNRGVSLPYDNRRPHTARVTEDLLVPFGWDIVTYSPYWPELATSGFHLFTELKEFTGGKEG
ncbi:hypothetical protein AAG570_012594 [Ranatra chinensis]|uniref:Uncharacterized protein n=1 Tax=Ranatra chinensis TaxID=642074 RepID=A0ABD0YG94_9HEMI